MTHDGATVWRSNSGAQPRFIRLVRLAPGHSLTLQATWDGHPNNAFDGGQSRATPTGTFVLHSEVTQFGASATPVTIRIEPRYGPAPLA